VVCKNRSPGAIFGCVVMAPFCALWIKMDKEYEAKLKSDLRNGRSIKEGYEVQIAQWKQKYPERAQDIDAFIAAQKDVSEPPALKSLSKGLFLR
jgi:hypothetical protein